MVIVFLHRNGIVGGSSSNVEVIVLGVKSGSVVLGGTGVHGGFGDC